MSINTKTLSQLPSIAETAITPDMDLLVTSPTSGEGRLSVDQLVAALSAGGNYYTPTVISTEQQW